MLAILFVQYWGPSVPFLLLAVLLLAAFMVGMYVSNTLLAGE
jgi:hypothetical protein